MVEWVGRSKRDEKEMTDDSAYGRYCSGTGSDKDLGRSPGIETNYYAIGACDGGFEYLFRRVENVRLLAMTYIVGRSICI